DSCAAPPPRPDLLDHRGLVGSPAPSGAHVPAIDDIADQEQRVGLMATEKFRNPYRAIVFDGGREQWRAVSGPFRRVRPLMIEYPIHRDAAPSISPSA